MSTPEERIKNYLLTKDLIPLLSPDESYQNTWSQFFSGYPQPTISYIEGHSKRSIWDVYRSMGNDGRIKAVMSSRLSAVANRGYIVTGINVPKTILSKAGNILKKVPYWQKGMKAVAQGIPQGYSTSEVVYVPNEEGNEWYGQIKEKHPRWFDFDRKTGELWIRDINGIFSEAMPPKEIAPDRKFIVHTPNERFGDRRGEAVLAGCYWYWYIKSQTLKYWAIFAGKYGDPSTIITLPDGCSKEEADLIGKFQKLIRGGGEIQLPFGSQFSTAEPRSTTSNLNIFQSLIQYCDEENTISFLGQTLSTAIGSVGSYAAMKGHMLVRKDIITEDLYSMEDTLNSTYIPWTVYFNLGKIKYKIGILFFRDSNADIQGLQTAWNMGTALPVTEIYEAIGCRQPEEGEPILARPGNLFNNNQPQAKQGQQKALAMPITTEEQNNPPEQIAQE